MLTVLVFTLTMVVGHLSAYCFHGNANKCQFTCHCENNELCDYVTGSCPGDRCNTSGLINWSGPGCQVGNIAAGKRNWDTTDSLTYDEKWRLYVDDSLHTNGQFPLILDTSGDYSYWFMNFGGRYVVQMVSVYFYQSQVYDSDVYISLLDSQNVEKERLRTGAPRYYAPSKSVRFDNVTATRIEIRKVDTQRYAAFKEIQVIGYQYVECSSKKGEQYFYGPGCLVPCHKGCDEQCHFITGDGCSICRPGYEGYNCQEPCRPGRWGADCAHSCNCEDSEEICSHTDGVCTVSGCPEFYAGDSCQLMLLSLWDTQTPVVSAVGRNVSVTFEQYNVTANQTNSNTTNIAYKVMYGNWDEGFLYTNVSTKHIEGERFNSLSFTVQESQKYYTLCVIPYNDVTGLQGHSSQFAKVYVNGPL